MKQNVVLLLALTLSACGTSGVAELDGADSAGTEDGAVSDPGSGVRDGARDGVDPGASSPDASSDASSAEAGGSDASGTVDDGTIVDRPGVDDGSGAGTGSKEAGSDAASSNPAGGTGDDANGGGPLSGGRTFDPCAVSPQPGFDPESRNLAACCAGVGPAHCVLKTDVVDRLSAELTPCDDAATVCMPDAIIRAGGQYRPSACISSLGRLAGACLSRCIAFIATNPQSVLLQQDTCGQGDLCIPCTNPLDGTPTGACNFEALLCPADSGVGGVADSGTAGTSEEGGEPDAADALGESAPLAEADPASDAGAVAPVDASDAGIICPYQGPPLIDPAIFPSCSPACGGAHCVPQAALPAEALSLLANCTSLGGAAGRCAPDVIIESGGNFVPRSCTSVAGAEGRCLSTCVPSVAGQGDLLPEDVCEIGERCAPCFDPTSADPTAPTGACSLACDAPAQAPVVITCPWTGPAVIEPAALPACSPACAGAHCLPAAYVPEDQRSQLEACPGGYCAPDLVIAGAGSALAPECTAFSGTSAAGRCLSSCLPQVASQPSLEPSTCDADSRCVPCNDPFTGAATGACSTSSCDAPPATPFTFPDCCASGSTFQGRCVPRSQIADAQEASLRQDVCAGTSSLCVPNDLLPGGDGGVGCSAGTIVPPLVYSGTCLSNCLNLGLGALLPQGNCPANHTCIPCQLAPGSPGCP